MTYIILFIISAAVSVYSAIKLSTYADIISKETKIGGMLAGTILLAVATSLPELTATGSAAVIGNADIAVGNGLGSIIFNIFVLFLLDIYFRRQQLFLRISDHHFLTGLLGLILLLLAGFALYWKPSFQIFGIGIMSISIAVAYFIGMGIISIKQNQNKQEEDEPASGEKKETGSIKRTLIRFGLFSVAIFVSGSGLSISGDLMAEATGISATAVGSLLIAAATSLPDAVGVYVALRVANIDLAIGAIMGSNLFNIFVITIADIFYREGSVWIDAEGGNISTIVTGMLLTLGIMLLIKRDRTRNAFTYVLPSVLAIIGYGVFTLVLLS
ncbi:sodium:calcium antiporter [Sediminibacillus massiliensis]|uniref:sodium:calcium antiporter n=1 Tax=Sediminibacillus massiliensis TaxID=1926277 RepID=UPI0009886A07|nr:sodium:calcium antiporter [Sediminibacillus massiliensis]